MNIFAGNLASSVTVDDLRMAFSGFGSVINAVIIEDPVSQELLGHAHIYLVPENAARRAIATLNHVRLRGKPMVVRECIFRSQRDRRDTRISWSDGERRHGLERRGSTRRYGVSVGAQRSLQSG